MPYVWVEQGSLLVPEVGGPPPPPPPPDITIGPDSIRLKQGESVTFNPVSNDVASDGSAITLTSVGPVLPNRGSVSRNGNNVTYIAPPIGANNFTGLFDIPYAIQTNSGDIGNGLIACTVDLGGGGPAPGKWWQKLWGPNNYAPRSGRPWNVGVFGSGPSIGPGPTSYQGYMGYYPDIVGGNIIADFKRCPTWAEYVGGSASIADQPLPLGPSLANDNNGTMPHLPSGGHSGEWMKNAMPAGITPDNTWLVIMFTTLPGNATLADARRNNSSNWKKMGERMRNSVINAGHDPTMIVGRPNWEGMNQQTGLHVGGGQPPPGPKQWYNNGLTTDEYNQMMAWFAPAFWEGYGHRMPLALSPAMDDYGYVHNKPGATYAGWWAAGIYDLACGSFHARDERISESPQEARDLVNGTGRFAEWHCPKDIIEFAQSKDVPACFFEWGPYPVPDQVLDGAPQHDVCMETFGQLVNANSADIAFTNCLNSANWNESWGVGKSPASLANNWRLQVQKHKQYFGKVTH